MARGVAQWFQGGKRTATIPSLTLRVVDCFADSEFAPAVLCAIGLSPSGEQYVHYRIYHNAAFLPNFTRRVCR